MHYTILLDRDEKTKEIEAQEQARFIKSILEALEIPLEWNIDEPFTIDSKIQFRKALSEYKIHIANDMDGGIKIFVADEVVAEWKKAKYVLKTDRSQVDPNKQLFLEMQVSVWSIFDTSND